MLLQVHGQYWVEMSIKVFSKPSDTLLQLSGVMRDLATIICGCEVCKYSALRFLPVLLKLT